ncbi:hypothetical protein [Helicobacter cetorum]|uniref:Uncharacterized protein n=1 Tax=Helicobacter cetorum (strain ATCC BAA-429 / MIT 00-7128) TaxID=182217 RepID=I0EML2_HELC0|nr:hypothetical protein [Helicobacter cetorum]AFI04181.1 hypothetical protein HCW_04570 [Helicobacter cetorum MIT 00-7128]
MFLRQYHFIRIVIPTIAIIVGLLGLWRLSYQATCFSLAFVLIILGIIAYSFISLKMRERKCFIKCYLNDNSLFTKLLSSKIMVSLVYFIISIMMTLSVIYSVLEYSFILWGCIFLQIFICAFVFQFLNRSLRKVVKQDYLALLSREWSINICSCIFFVIYFCIVVYGYEPTYLRDNLKETLELATNSIGSNCEYIDYFLRIKRELDALSWWGMNLVDTKLGSYRVLGWSIFIALNILSSLGINRVIMQVIYWVNGYSKRLDESMDKE